MSLCNLQVSPILFGANVYPSTGYLMWTGTVDQLLDESTASYVETYDGTGLGSAAHFKCTGSLRFPSPTDQSVIRTIVLRLIADVTHHASETEQLKSGLDVRAYVDGQDLGFPDAVNYVSRGSDLPYTDYYWKVSELTGVSSITRFDLSAYLLKASSTVANVRVYYASLFYCTANETTWPEDSVFSESYPLNYPGFGDNITIANINDTTVLAVTTLNSPAALPPVYTVTLSPPPPPPPPPPAQVALSPPRTREGKLVTSVPFSLKVQPINIPLRVDSLTEFYSGDLDVSLHVQPGSSQGRTYRVTDTVTLDVTETSLVSRVSSVQTTDTATPLTGVTVQVTPNVLSVKTGFVHRKTGKIVVHNYSAISQDFLISAEGSTGIPGQGDQSVIQFETVLSTVDPGGKVVLLYALQSNSETIGTESFRIVVKGTYGTILAEEWLTINHHPDNALGTTYYIAGDSAYSFRIGLPVGLNLQTLSGPTGTERWRLSDPKFLLDHNLVCTPTGQIYSTGVTGPVSQASIMVIASTEASPGQRSYAARVLTFNIVV